MIFGQIGLSEAVHFGADVAVVAGVVIAWVVSRHKKETRRILPDPLRTKQIFDPVSEDEFIKRHDSITQQLKEMGQQRERDLVAQAGARKPLHDEIAKVRQEMIEMERRLNADNERRADKLREEVKEVLKAVSRLDGKVSAQPPQATT